MEAPDHLTASAQLQEKLMKGLAAIPRITNGSLRLGSPPEPQEPQTSSPGLEEEERETDAHETHYPVGFFDGRHSLTPAQVWEANRLLAKADRERPIRGKNAQERHARRVAGVLVAVRHGKVGNAQWGRSMLAKRGGNVLRDHAKSHLRAIARRGGEAAKAARANKKAVAHWEKTSEVLPLDQTEIGQSVPTMDAWAAAKPFLLW